MIDLLLNAALNACAGTYAALLMFAASVIALALRIRNGKVNQ